MVLGKKDRRNVLFPGTGYAGRWQDRMILDR